MRTNCFLLHNALGMGPLKQATSLVETIFKNENTIVQNDRYILFVPDLDNFEDYQTTAKTIVIKVPLHKSTILKLLIRLIYDLFIIPATCYRYKVSRLYCLFNYYPFRLSASKTLALRHDYLLNRSETDNLTTKNKIIEWLRFSYFKISVKSSDAIIFQNDIALSAFRERFDYQSKKLFILPNPVNSFFEKGRKPIVFKKNNEKLIFYPSAYYSHKNHKLLVNLVLDNKNFFTTNNLKIGITIDTKNVGGYTLLKDIKEKQVDNILINHGSLSIQSMREVYDKCFCILYPSLIESFGNSLVESLKIGIPIIANKKPYAISACGDAALYFENNDTKRIVELLTKLLQDNTFYKSRVNASLLQSENYYGFDIWLRKMIDFNAG